MTIQRPLSHHLQMASATGTVYDLYDIGVPLGCRRRGEKASGQGIMVSDAGGAEGIGSHAYPSLSRSNYVLIGPYTFPLSGDDIY